MPKYRLLSPQVVEGVMRPAGYEVEISGALEPGHPKVGPAMAYTRAEALFGKPDPERRGWRAAVDPIQPDLPDGQPKTRLEEGVRRLIESGWQIDLSTGSTISPEMFERLAGALQQRFNEGVHEVKSQSDLPQVLASLLATWEEYKKALASFHGDIDAAHNATAAAVEEARTLVIAEFF